MPTLEACIPPLDIIVRAGRCSIPGQIYLVTTTTRRRAPLFADRRAAIAACRMLCEPSTWGDARLLCWVLMPDHWHGLIELGHMEPLPLVVNRFTSCVAKAVRGATPATRRVWALAYHDRAARKEEALIDIGRYIVMNPVRAGLVARVRDYPYWNAVWL